MGMFGKSSWVIVGLILIVSGLIIKSDFISGFLELMGWLLVIAGAVALIAGLIGMITGKNR